MKPKIPIENDDDKMYDKIIMSKEFTKEVMEVFTDPFIENSNEDMYNELLEVLQHKWRDRASGEIVDTLKLMIFSVVSQVMKENAIKSFDDQREDLK